MKSVWRKSAAEVSRMQSDAVAVRLTETDCIRLTSPAGFHHTNFVFTGVAAQIQLSWQLTVSVSHVTFWLSSSTVRGVFVRTDQLCWQCSMSHKRPAVSANWDRRSVECVLLSVTANALNTAVECDHFTVHKHYHYDCEQLQWKWPELPTTDVQGVLVMLVRNMPLVLAVADASRYQHRSDEVLSQKPSMSRLLQLTYMMKEADDED